MTNLNPSVPPSNIGKKQQILDLYTSSYINESEIARQVGCSPSYVSRCIKTLALTQADVYGMRKASLFNQVAETITDRLKQLKTMIESQDSLASPLPAMLTELKYLERLSKMFGLDAAQQVDVSIVAAPTQIIYEAEGEVVNRLDNPPPVKDH